MRLLLFSFLLTLITTNAYAQGTQLHYTITIDSPQTHYARVDMRLEGWRRPFVEIKMPVWIPGSYMVREFARNVERFTAADETGNPLRVSKVRKNVWRIETRRVRTVNISYHVYAKEYTVRTSYIDADHATLNPTSILMYPDGRLGLPSTITVHAPHAWKVLTTPLRHSGHNPWVLFANGYDELADSPIEIGNHDTFSFKAAGVHHTVAMIGEADYDQALFTADVSRVINACKAVFGSHPCTHFTFFIHHGFNGGGLEHANSTSILISPGRYHSEGGYRSLMGLIAHEYFHIWNVKRLRPSPLGPFDYDNENYTTLLWQVEGFTSYYDEMLLFRAGLADRGYILDKMAQIANEIANTPGSAVQSISESSFDAWIKFYRRNENSVNSTVSYYGKGTLVALCLDLMIIHHSKGKHNLDDVMRGMYETYFLKHDRPFTEANLKASLEYYAGISLDRFFRDHIHGTVPLPVEQCLGYAGYIISDTSNGAEKAWLGVQVQRDFHGPVITEVIRNSTAWHYGLNVGDEIVSVNTNTLTTPQELVAFESEAKPGDTWVMSILRQGRMRTLVVRLGPDTRKRYSITEIPQPDGAQLLTRQKWLAKSTK